MIMRCRQRDLENFRDEWRTYAARWRSQDSTLLRNQFLKNIEISVIEALYDRFGTDNMTNIPISRLFIEIERIAVVKQSDLFNKVRSGRTFGDRLRALAYV